MESAPDIKTKETIVESNDFRRWPSIYTGCPDSKTFFNDSDINAQLYNLMQCYAKNVKIEDESGHFLRWETRTYKRDLNKTQMRKMLGLGSHNTVDAYLNYMLNPSMTNKFCPYLEWDEEGKYWLMLKKENYYINIPRPMCEYLKHGYSKIAIKIYAYLLTIYKHQQENKPNDLEKFTFMQLAVNVGFPSKDPAGRAYVWGKIIPDALQALQRGGLIKLGFERDKRKRPRWILLYVNTKVPTIKEMLNESVEVMPELQQEANQLLDELEILDNKEATPELDDKTRHEKIMEVARRMGWIGEEDEAENTGSLKDDD